MCKGSQIFVLKSPMHIVCFVLNCLLPGWGTMISASSCTHAVRDPERKCSCGTFTDGMFQFYLCPLLFGWIWSIIVGWNIYKKGRDLKNLLQHRDEIVAEAARREAMTNTMRNVPG